MKCLGRNFEDHCCYVEGKPCDFLEENTTPGFRWACGLRRELGDWDKVINDPRYLDGPGKIFRKFGINCKDWPNFEHACQVCGVGTNADSTFNS